MGKKSFSIKQKVLSKNVFYFNKYRAKAIVPVQAIRSSKNCNVARVWVRLLLSFQLSDWLFAHKLSVNKPAFCLIK